MGMGRFQKHPYWYEGGKGMSEFKELEGKVITNVMVSRGDDNTGEDAIIFETTECNYKMYHSQSCCENVVILDVCGDLEDLIGTQIVVAEERTNCQNDLKDHDSVTWTFYTIRTVKGTIDIIWKGTSNGYYSESVDFEELK